MSGVRKGTGEFFVALLVSLLLAVLFTGPWHPNPVTAVAAFTGPDEIFARADVANWVYGLSWGARHPDNLYDASILNPVPHSLTTGEPRITENLWSIPVFRILDPVTGWGVMIWIGFAATSLGSYAAGRWLTGSRWAGAALAVLYAFNAYRARHIHLVEASFAPFLPIALVGLVLFLERPTRRNGLALGMVTALAAIEHLYTTVLLFTVLPPALLWGARLRRVPLSRALWPLLSGAALTALAYFPMAVLYYDQHRQTGLERPFFDIDWWSATWSTWMPWCGDLRKSLFPGWIVTAMGLWGLGRVARREPGLVAAALVSVALSFGTLRVLFWEAGLPFIEIPTPYELLHEHLLPFRAVRVVTRFGGVAHLVLAIGGALLAADWARRGRGLRVALLIILAASFLEARRPIGSFEALPARARDESYRWIAAQPGRFGVVDAPMGLETDREGVKLEIDALYAAAVHGKPTPNGSRATIIPWHESIAAHLARPDPSETPEILRALGVRYVVARDSATAEGFRHVGLASVFVSPGGFEVLEAEAPLTVPENPAELQARLFELSHHRIDEPFPGLGGRFLVPDTMTMGAGSFRLETITVVNDGRETWCGNGALLGLGPTGDVIPMMDRLEADGGGAEEDPRDPRGFPIRWGGALPCEVAPGESATVTFHCLAPRRPGVYRAYFDLVVRNRGAFHPPDRAPSVMTLVVE